MVSIYGGRPYEPQIESLQKGADVVVGTPGRLLDLAQQGHLQLGGLSVLVLDEADEMLDLGFLPDIERILSRIPDDRQSMLFSATMPGPIITLARTFMNQPTHIRAEGVQGAATHDTTEQFAYRAHALDKIEMVARILQAEGRGATMVFTRTKRTAQKVADELAERGFKVGAVHGDLGQIAREKALKAFRAGEVDVLVATDVAARGIDIDDITHVINYQIPEDEQAYVHRIGRTGRAGKTGIAITLVDWDELDRWSMINTALKLDCPDPAGDLLQLTALLRGALHPGRGRRDGRRRARRPGHQVADRTRFGQRFEWFGPGRRAIRADVIVGSFGLRSVGAASPAQPRAAAAHPRRQDRRGRRRTSRHRHPPRAARVRPAPRAKAAHAVVVAADRASRPGPAPPPPELN